MCIKYFLVIMTIYNLEIIFLGSIRTDAYKVNVAQKSEAELLKTFKETKKENFIDLVLFVAAATEEPPENLIKTISEATNQGLSDLT